MERRGSETGAEPNAWSGGRDQSLACAISMLLNSKEDHAID